MITPTEAGSATRSRAERDALLPQPPRDRRVARQGLEVGGPALDVRRDRAQLWQCRHVDPAVEAGHDLARLEVADRGQVARVQAFEQHRPTARVGPQQQDGAVAVPVLEREVLEVRLVGVDVGVQLEHGAVAVGGQHRHHERAEAVHQRAVDGQVPLVEQVAGQGGQPVDPRGPVVAAVAHRQHVDGQVDRHPPMRPAEPHVRRDVGLVRHRRGASSPLSVSTSAPSRRQKRAAFSFSSWNAIHHGPGWARTTCSAKARATTGTAYRPDDEELPHHPASRARARGRARSRRAGRPARRGRRPRRSRRARYDARWPRAERAARVPASNHGTPRGRGCRAATAARPPAQSIGRLDRTRPGTATATPRRARASPSGNRPISSRSFGLAHIGWCWLVSSWSLASSPPSTGSPSTPVTRK